MKYIFKATGDKLQTFPNPVLYTGNSASYCFEFIFDESWDNLIKVGVFTKNDAVFHVFIENSVLTVPNEVLAESGEFTFGIFGTNGDDEIRRISTNQLTFKVSDGAYNNLNIPSCPTPDLWEKLFVNSIPKIIDGRWHIYNLKDGVYRDTGIEAIAYTPKKGVDYFTDNDIASLNLDGKENIKNKTNSIGENPGNEKYPTELAVSQFVNNAINKAVLDSWEVSV